MQYEYDKFYINDVAFPLLPGYDKGLNDVDSDSYTNTKGFTIRQRVRANVNDDTFNISVLVGKQIHDLIQMTKDVWFTATYFDEESWTMKSRKMYRSGTIKYHPYYLDPKDPNKNIYTNINFSIIEE